MTVLMTFVGADVDLLGLVIVSEKAIFTDTSVK
jgi:hypothetical protein